MVFYQFNPKIYEKKIMTEQHKVFKLEKYKKIKTFGGIE